MRRFYLLLVFIAFGSTAFGQALSSYTFSAFSSTYTTITGTVPTYSNEGSLSGTTYDDASFNAIPIGFSFVYCGNTYTTVSANTNGWIVLGHNITTTKTTYSFENDLPNSLGNNMPRPILAALWDDLSSSSDPMLYTTTGTAPNRIFTIQWDNSDFLADGGSTARFSFQIKLYETSNVIDFCYKKISASSVGSASIGITDGDGASVTGTVNYWSLSGSGSSPTASMTTDYESISSSPATNQVYRWSPNCDLYAAVAGSNSAVCAGNTLSLTGNTDSGTATTWAWTGPGSYSSTSQNPVITGVTTAAGGTYTLTASDATCTVTATTSVTVNPLPTASISGTTNFCSGGLAFITFSGTAGSTVYYHINSGTEQSGVLGAGGTLGVSTGTLYTGTSAATYTYHLDSVSNGTCTQTYSSTAVVTVNPNPRHITASATSVCTGYTINVSDPDAGGTWSSDNAPVAGVLGSGTTAVVTGAMAGTANIIYTFPTGCDTMVNITVNTTPAITGATHVCEGSSTTLTAAPTGGTWLSTNPAAATIDATNGGMAGVAMGTTLISYTIASTGCYVVQADTTFPQPGPVLGFDVVCAGGATTPLTEDSTDGVWTSSSNPTATVVSSGPNSATVTGGTAGTVTISYTTTLANYAGCYSTHTMTVNPLPVDVITPAGPTTFCDFDSVVLGGSVATGNVYQWSNSSGPISGATEQTYTAYTSDTYSVAVLDTNSCQAFSAPVTVTVNPLPSMISGPTVVCQLASITLSDSVSGGSWGSSNGTIASAATISGTTGTATGGINYGNVTMSYTLGTGCYRTYDIHVDSIPGPIAGTLAVCEAGSTTTLTDDSTGGAWSMASSYASMDASGVVTGMSAGTAYAYYTYPSTGCYVSAAVTVNPLPTSITGSPDVCVTFNDAMSSGPLGGTWSTSATGNASINSSGIVTGMNQGPDTVTYTLGTGCKVDFPLTVHPLPGAIHGTLSVCEAGSTTTLTDDSTGGTWGISDPTKALIDPITGVVTGESAGTVTVTYTFISTGCYVTATLVVNPLPAAITGADSVCVGSTVTLASSGVGTWTSSDGTLASVSATGVVTGHDQGQPIITYTLGTGCLQTLKMNVHDLPAPITGTTEVCAGLSVTLADDSTGGSWASNNAGVASVDAATGIVTGTSTSGVAVSATITYTLPTGCISTTSVLVNPLPSSITGATAVCYGAQTTFSDVTTPGTWTTQNGTIATVTSGGVVTGSGVGTTNITYTLPTGCVSVKPITVNALPVGIAGSNQVCLYSSTSLTDGTSGGTWSSINSAVASVVGGDVTGNTLDTTTIIYSLTATGCYTTLLMTVNPLPLAITGTTSVCQYATTTLSDASGTGTWSSSDNTKATVNSSGVVTGVNPGSATITFTLPTGCYVTTTVTINASPVPITGTTTLCVGATSTLSDSPTGGTWSIASGTAASINTSGVVSGLSAGTAIADYTLGGCSETATITVNPLPGASIMPIGDTLLCPGEFVVLAANTGTGLTYQWYSGASIITGATASTYVATTGAFYKVKVTNSFTCVSTSSPMDVTVNPATATATALGSTSICGFSSVILDANTGAGLSYQWLKNGVPVPGATSSNYAALGTSGAANYNVVVTNAAGCSATSTPSISTSILPTPSDTLVYSGDTTFCAGGSVTLTADASTGLSYQWYNGTTAISGATTNTYTASTTGIYSVNVTNSVPCTASPSVDVVAIALPSATITPVGASVFCVGGSVVLNVPSVPTNTYQWYQDGSMITGATNADYTTTTGGTFSVVVDAITGCSDSTAPGFAVGELTTPYVTPLTDTGFCWGGGALLGLGLSTATGVTFQWQLNGVNIPGATGSTYTATATGYYSALVSLPTCGATSYSEHVTEYPLPNPVVSFDGVTLSTQNYFTSYQWYRNMSPIAGAVGSSIIPTDTGSYEVRVTDSNGCQSVSPAYPLSASLAVGNVKAQTIKVYPNPATSIVHIQSSEPLRAVLFTVDGRSVLQQDNVQDIDISGLASGVYTLMLYDKEGVMVQADKLLKE